MVSWLTYPAGRERPPNRRREARCGRRPGFRCPRAPEPIQQVEGPKRETTTMSSYALTTLWHERQRYLPGILAVAFSALLIALQCGLLLGLFSITSIPVDHGRAHIWVGSPDVLSVDLGRPIPAHLIGRLASQPEVEPPEMFYQGFSIWKKPTGGSDLCM